MTSRTSTLPDVLPPPDPEGAPPGRRRRARRGVLVGLLLAGCAVVAAVLLPVAPVRMSTPVVTWPQVPGQPVSTMLELTAQRPVTLDVRFSCADARAAGATADGVLLATIRPDAASAPTEGLVVRVRDDVLAVTSAGSVLTRTAVPAGACTYQLHGDGDGLRLTRDGAELGRAPVRALPQVDVLATSLFGSPAAQLSVRIAVDDQFATSPGPAKLALIALALAAAAGSLLWLRTQRPARAPARRLGISRRRIRWTAAWWVRRAADGGVLAALLLWTLIAPMTGDDGYYAAMARNAPQEGYVGNYYQLLNQSFTPFTWFYQLLGWWEELVGSSPVLLRVPALAAGVATYALAARVVAAVPWGRAGARTAAHTLLGLAFLAWWLPFDMGVRPESVVGLAGTATLAAVVAARRRRDPFWWGIAVLVASVGFVCHPTGFVVVAPLLASLPAAVRQLRSGQPARTAARVLAVLAPAAAGSAAAFADGTLRDFLRGQQIFLAAQDQAGWTDEYQRWALLLGDDFMGAYAKRLPVLVTLVALAVWLLVAAALRGRGRPVPPLLHLAAVSTGLSLLLLWPTPSKWTYHFGSLAGVGCVFLTLALVQLGGAARRSWTSRPVRWPGLLAVTGAVVLAVALSFAGPNSWPSSWELGVPYADEAPHLAGLPLQSLPLWVLVVAAAAVAVRFRRRRRGPGADARGALAGALPLVVVASLLLSTAYLLGGFALATVRTLPGWSPWADGVRDPLATRCGAAAAFRVLDDEGGQPLAALPGQPAPPTGPADVFGEGSGWYAAVPPPSTATDVRGSLQPPAGEDAVGTTTTGWSALPAVDPGERRVAVTVAGRLGTGNRLVAEYGRGTAGGVDVVARQDLGDGIDSPYWRTVLLDARVPGAAGATAVRLVATDGSTGVGGWLAFSAPQLRDVVPVQRYLADREPVAVAWQIALLFPCQAQAQPRAQAGITEPARAGILYGTSLPAQFGDATWLVRRGALFAPLLREASVTGLPTALPGAPSVDDVQVYRFENPYPAGRYDLVRGTTTVPGWAAPPGWGDRPAG